MEQLRKNPKIYTVYDIHRTLNSYATKEFGDTFFNNYIYKSGMPDFEKLFMNVGVTLETLNAIDFGASVRRQIIVSNTKIGSAAYDANLQKDDKILQIDTIALDGNADINAILNTFKEGDTIQITFDRFGIQKETMLIIKTEVSYGILLMDEKSKEFKKSMKENQNNWLNPK